MRMKRKIIVSVTGLIVLIAALTITLHLLTEDNSSKPLPADAPSYHAPPETVHNTPQKSPGKVQAKKKITAPKIDDLKKSEDLDMDLVDESLREYILSLYFKFRNAEGKDEFLTLINARIMEDFPPETAKKIMKIYEAYIDCELKLQEQLITYDQPETEEDMLFIANDIFEFRKSQMGEELAEKLFGQEHNLITYKILNKKIYENDSLYGAEKESQLRLLAAEIFGDNADENIYDKTGESLFQEKKLLYHKDFSEMSEDEKKMKIREFREEYMTVDEIEKVEAAEAKIESDGIKDTNYSEGKSIILNDPSLSDEKKQKEIEKLRTETYGDMAEEIRRGEEFARQQNENLEKLLKERDQQ